MPDDDQQRRQRRFDRYERLATAPLLVNGLVYIGCFATLLTDPDDIARALFQVTWALFVVDYVLSVALAPRRWRWVTTHLAHLVALVFPPVRIVLLVLLAHRAVTSRNSPLRDRVGLIALYATSVIVVFGAYFVWQFERYAPGATIRTYGESLWWAVVTITTVGYGDYVPVTVGGRVIAVIVLANGIAAIGVLTGVIVSFFATDVRARRAPVGSRTVPKHTESIDSRLAAIESALGIRPQGSPALPDPAPRMPKTVPTPEGTDDEHGAEPNGPALGPAPG